MLLLKGRVGHIFSRRRRIGHIFTLVKNGGGEGKDKDRSPRS
ncbi:MAG: hypothetical protein QXK69_11945 [Candidatus Caldarchaeum sp.]